MLGYEHVAGRKEYMWTLAIYHAFQLMTNLSKSFGTADIALPHRPYTRILSPGFVLYGMPMYRYQDIIRRTIHYLK